jgi:hypothetical protein
MSPENERLEQTIPGYFMNTQILSKLTIFAAAFLINGLMFAGVNHLFNGPTHQRTARASLAQSDGSSTAADAGVDA